MNDSELQSKGAEVRRQLLGDARFERSNATTYGHPMMRQFIEIATTSVFGALWARPGLDLKTRTLVVLVSDAATGRVEELPIHLHMALRQGWTQEELTEVLLQLMGYIGAPLVREAMLTAIEVFKEAEKEKTPAAS